MTTTDTWTQESFEDEISRAMIALYETTIAPTPHQGTLRSFRSGDLLTMRKHGVIVPARDRIAFIPEKEEAFLDNVYQFVNLPESGCISSGAYNTHLADDTQVDSYCRIHYFQRLRRLPDGVVSMAPGVPYEVISIFPRNAGAVVGFSDYMTVDQAKGQVMPAIKLKAIKKLGAENAFHQRLLDAYKYPLSLTLGVSLQFVDDMQHQWRITAVNEDTKVTVGAYPENVKSLLYSRELPMTPSGRKRPILHLVSAHRRRLQAGTDIDIKKFLRGTREIEMGGSVFKVEAPQRLIDEILQDKGN